MKTENKITEHTNHFWCNNCDPKLKAEPMTPTQVKEHLQGVHKLTELKGRRELIMALDGDFYQNSFVWTIGYVKLTNVKTGPASHH